MKSLHEPYISAAMKIPNEFSTGIGVQLNKSETKERWENMRNIALFGNAKLIFMT